MPHVRCTGEHHLIARGPNGNTVRVPVPRPEGTLEDRGERYGIFARLHTPDGRTVSWPADQLIEAVPE